MSKAILGTKLGMSQVFAENGDLIPVSVIEVLPNVVAAVKTVESDGYNAVQLGYGAVKEKHLTKPVKGQFEKAGIDPVKYLREYRLAEKPSYTVTGSGGGGTHIYHWEEPRALTNRERARLQTFPDTYEFQGTKESVRKQIGMAVPCRGAQIIFEAILKSFAGIDYPSIEANIDE